MRSTAPPLPVDSRRSVNLQRRWGLALTVGLACALSIAGSAYWYHRSQLAPPAGAATETVRWGNLHLTVTSSGAATPLRTSDLAPSIAGRVAELLVQPGQPVTAGQPLLRLDTTELRRAVAQAEVDLAAAEARLTQTRSGETRPADLAEAEARVAAARAQLDQTRNGTAKPAEVAGATAALDAAEARLDALLAPGSADRVAAEAAVTRAREQRDATRAARSAAKVSAEADVQQAANAVRAAQQTVSDSYWQLQRGTGTPQADALQQAYDQAVRDEQDAQARLQQARVAYERAVAEEVADLGAAEAALAEAEARLAALHKPDPRAVAEARAAVAQARATREALLQGSTPAEIDAAEAALAQAVAQRDSLVAPAAPAEIVGAEAALAQARLNLQTARDDLAAATLSAPFAGIVAAVQTAEGAPLAANTPALTLIDTSSLQLTLDLSEYDVQQVAVGQPVAVSFEALPGQTFAGAVTAVAPVGEESGSITTFAVTVRFEPGDAKPRVGMTGDAVITVATRVNVIQVPSRALQGEGELRRLRLRRAGATEAVSLVVRVGLSDGVMTEVLGCLPDGAQCLNEGDQVELSLPTTQDNPAPGGQAVLIEGPIDAGGAGAPQIKPLGTP